MSFLWDARLKWVKLEFYNYMTLRTERTNDQGPVIQSVVSLTNSLRVISLTVLADSKYNILIFFAEKI